MIAPKELNDNDFRLLEIVCDRQSMKMADLMASLKELGTQAVYLRIHYLAKRDADHGENLPANYRSYLFYDEAADTVSITILGIKTVEDYRLAKHKERLHFWREYVLNLFALFFSFAAFCKSYEAEINALLLYIGQTLR